MEVGIAPAKQVQIQLWWVRVEIVEASRDYIKGVACEKARDTFWVLVGHSEIWPFWRWGAEKQFDFCLAWFVHNPICVMDCLQGHGNHCYVESLLLSFTNICSTKNFSPNKLIAKKEILTKLEERGFSSIICQQEIYSWSIKCFLCVLLYTKFSASCLLSSWHYLITI